MDKYIPLIEKYYRPQSKAYEILLTHSTLVMNKAISIATALNANVDFVAEASFLHDIGIIFTHAPGIHCHGTSNYLCHGYIGREILEKEGLFEHALVCERHTGVGLSKNEIIEQNLPLPHRDMTPLSLEEKIICYADNFFSKTSSDEKTVQQITRQLSKFGKEKVDLFYQWHKRFSLR